MAGMNFNTMISGDFSGFGNGSIDDVNLLSKALDPGYATSIAAQTGGGALRVQSLEQSLKILTFTLKQMGLWRKIPKQKAFSTVEEYTQVTAVGSNPTTANFVPAGVLPNEDTSVLQRQYASVKFIGSTRRITAQQLLINNQIEDVRAYENQMALTQIISTAEYGMYYGNHVGNNNNEYVQFDGLKTYFNNNLTGSAKNNYIDLRGASLTPDNINDAAQLVLDNYGFPTAMIMSYDTLNQFTKTWINRQTVFLPIQANSTQEQTAMTTGVNIENYATQAGLINFVPDIFLKKTPPPPTTDTSGLTINSSGSATATGTYSGGTTWEGTVANGTVFHYFITASNRFGEIGVPDVSNTNLFIDYTSTGADLTSITLSGLNNLFQNTAVQGDTAYGTPQHINIYRVPLGQNPDKINLSNYYRVGQVPYNTAGTSFTDSAQTLPNTNTAYVLQFDDSVIAVKQLAPAMSIQLALIDPSIRWMVLLYMTLVLYAPNKIVEIRNIQAF